MVGSFYERLSDFSTEVVSINTSYGYFHTIPVMVNIDGITIRFNGGNEAITLQPDFTDVEIRAIIHKKSTYPWITPITNRTNENITEAENSRYPSNTSGIFNYADLNRIETNTIYVKEYMANRLITHVMPSMTHKTDWAENETVDSVNMTRIIENVRRLMELSNPVIQNDLLPLSVSNALTYQIANAIEHNLDVMHTQPELVEPTYTVRLNGGIIQETGTNIGEFEADRAIHIIANTDDYTGIDKYSMGFTYWSGDNNDLQYVGDVNESSTVFFCQHHDTELTAHFQNNKVVRVIVEQGYIYGERPCTVGEYYDLYHDLGIPSLNGSVAISQYGGSSYANIEEVLTIEYMMLEDSYHYHPEWQHSKFFKWRFYCYEPFSDGLHELDAENILLNNCNSASTMIKVPNVSMLIIRPQLIYIPNRIIVRNTMLRNDTYDDSNLGQTTYDFELRKRIYTYCYRSFLFYHSI